MSQQAVLGVAVDEWLAPVSWGGLSAYCTGYLMYEGHTVYLSLIGRVTAVKAIWAAFMDHQPIQLPDETQLLRLPTDEETKYHTLKARLPDTGWGHTAIVHSQATQENLPDRVFYVLNGSADPPLHRFWLQWNRCQPYPTQPEWAVYLWQQGIQHQLIIEGQSRGTYGWAVRPEEEWAKVITNGVQSGAIGL